MPPHSTTLFQQDDHDDYSYMMGCKHRRHHSDELCVRGARPRRRAAAAPTAPASPNNNSGASSQEQSQPLTPESQPRPLVMQSNPTKPTTATKKKQFPPRRVSFASVSSIALIPHVNELTPEEISNAWFSRQEMGMIRKNCVDTVAVLNSGQLNLPEGIETRGLEHHTVSFMEQRKQIKRCANEAVFGMQKFQNFKGLSLPTLMAELYETSAEASKQRAIDIARVDAMIAAC